ncbi:MAG TPA: translation factor GTPase family protein [Streptosporangiaceae bacterium]|nr:translation factor GTPase family protein [Streptosporangiaceae bacterium]
MRTLNLGILAHVDAGKTSLTERLLFAAGVIDEVGSVDDGSTQTDSLALERQRGITIKSAVVSFVIDDVMVNLIDTPGHPDFIAEVERVLGVLDGAVLVISAVEGVQAQTRVLMRTLQRLHIPALIFVNKIDCCGAHHERVLQGISAKLTHSIVPMGSTRDLGTHSAGFAPYGAGDAAFTTRLADVLADHDDAFLAAYIDDETAVSYRQLRGELAAQARRGLVHPVFFGSAITGAGTDSLSVGITEMLPATEGNADGPVSGTVFKVERGPAGEKIAYVRVFSGILRVRDRLQFGRHREGKITAIRVFDRGSAVQRASVTAGQIGKLWGLGNIQIGDMLGVSPTTSAHHYFAPPTLETVVVPARPADKSALHVALAQLAEQDPLINLRQDDVRQEILVSLYGEVQKEVIQATLANDYDIDVGFRETTTICIERPIGTGVAVEIIWTAPNPFLGTVGLRVDPAAIDSGVQFRLAVELGSMPFSFMKAVEETVRETLRQGIYGWQVTDCTVTMTHSGYCSVSSTAGDFRNLTPLVLMSALKQAGTRVYEPMHRFRLEVPADLLGPILPVLARLCAVPRTSAVRGSSCTLEGDIPAARMHDLHQQLPALTRGEGVLDCAFDRYQPVRGTIPTRPRSDHNPLNRKEYLLHVVRGVAGRMTARYASSSATGSTVGPQCASSSPGWPAQR